MKMLDCKVQKQVIILMFLATLLFVGSYYNGSTVNAQTSTCNKCIQIQNNLAKAKELFQKTQSLLPQAIQAIQTNEKLLKATPPPEPEAKNKITTINAQLNQMIPLAKELVGSDRSKIILALEKELAKCIQKSCDNKNKDGGISTGSGASGGISSGNGINTFPANPGNSELSDLDILRAKFLYDMNNLAFCAKMNIINNMGGHPSHYGIC
ncbi:hypothetical protein [Candidatus Nitrosocosmicus sp. T]